jgi:hypothetical protein
MGWMAVFWATSPQNTMQILLLINHQKVMLSYHLYFLLLIHTHILFSYITEKSTRKDCNVILTSAIPDKKFVRATYTLPVFFSQLVDNKLKKGEALTFLDFGCIARELGKSIQQNCTTIDSTNIRYVVGKLVSKYPHVLGEVEESRVDFEVSFYCSIFTFRLELIALFLFIESSLPENLYLFRKKTS